ncbi:Bombyrin precursor [Danaus plexippus plexippus]|uniref:Bombyrin n=1 Tax=Danaus plexippus plexippus TaxID=278856 RepID=A0A212F388_DANPL|nr:Bombyrin precursor [Danaus plexippus plexippus]
MYAVVFLALVASALAEVYVDSRCPDIQPVQNFDVANYGKGVWYEIARYPNRKEMKIDCGHTEYTPQGDHFSVKNLGFNNGKLMSIEGVAKLAEDAGNSGKLIFTLPYGASGKKTDNVLNVLYTDYDNFAIVYHCQFHEEKNSRQDFAWILSRSKSLSPELKAKVDKFVSESKVLDSSKFVWPDFSDKACKASA